jgi:RNA polymerase sigma-70 factor, ECF subfamily
VSDDRTRIERYLAGAADAYAEVDDWIRRAGSSFRERLGNDFDDTLQDVRLEVTRLLGRGTFRGESSLKTYIWRVTANACLDRLRSRARASFEDLEVLEQRPQAALDSAAQSTWAHHTRDLLLRVLAETSDECKSLWQMVFAGLSYQEMSVRTGVSEGALRVRVLRCRRRAVALRDEIEAGPVSSPGSQARNEKPEGSPKHVGR